MRAGTILAVFSCLLAAALGSTPAPADPTIRVVARPGTLDLKSLIIQEPGADSPGQAPVVPRSTTLERYPMPVAVKDPALYPMPVARHNPLQYRIQIIRPGEDGQVLDGMIQPGMERLAPAQPFLNGRVIIPSDPRNQVPLTLVPAPEPRR